MSYRLVLAAILAALAAPAAALAADTSTAPSAAVLATVDEVLTAAQAGDLKQLRKEYLPNSIFIDEFAPYFWSGKDSINAYFASAAAMYKATGMVDTKLSRGSPKYAYVADKSAYVVVPVSVTAKLKGKPYNALGTLLFTLHETDSGWKILSQSWTKNSENLDPY